MVTDNMIDKEPCDVIMDFIMNDCPSIAQINAAAAKAVGVRKGFVFDPTLQRSSSNRSYKRLYNEMLYHGVHPGLRTQIDRWVLNRFNAMSQRSKNNFPLFCNTISLIRYPYAQISELTQNIRGCGRKTFTEINAFLRDFAEYFDSVVSNENQVLLDTSDLLHDIYVEEVRALFPFLTDEEDINLIIKHFRAFNSYPYLHLIMRYVEGCDDIKVRVHSGYYAFHNKAERQSLDQLAKMAGFTRERIRQITIENLHLPQQLRQWAVTEILYRLDDIMAFDDPLWDELVAKYSTEVYADISVPRLAASLFKDYSIVAFHDCSCRYLVRRSLVQDLGEVGVWRDLCREVSLRSTRQKHLDILDFIRGNSRSRNTVSESLCRIYAECLIDRFGDRIWTEDYRHVVVMPNNIDVMDALAVILEECGRPMDGEELLRAYNLKHPEYALEKVSQIRAYIMRSDQIVALGKRGLYALKSWDMIYTGHLTEYLELTLKNAPAPIHLDTLTEIALQVFPKTNRNSVYSLLLGDHSDRFVAYEQSHFGHVDNMGINDLGHKLYTRLSHRNRMGFAERLNELESFIVDYLRLPQCNGPEDGEPGLGRWLYNLRYGNIEVSAEDTQALEAMLCRYSHLPQNKTEHNFQLMCEAVKYIVAETKSLPNRKLHPKEHLWLSSNRVKYSSYTDNRRQYFESLHNDLMQLGHQIIVM